MLFNISYLEWLGYLSSIIVAISLTMSSIIKLRVLNLIGGIAFTFYGFLIGSLPVGLLNLFMIGVNVFYLIKIYSHKEAFKLLKINLSDSYLNYYLDFNKNDIKQFFPSFTLLNLAENKNNLLTFCLLRNELIAGVFIGIKNETSLTVVLDYVSAPYRDLKPGEFLYQQNNVLLKEYEINRIEISTDNEQHIKYLRKMNFKFKQNGLYVLALN